MYEVMDHPEAPAPEEMGEYLVEPVAPEEIREKRESGLTLVEANLLQHDDVDAYVELSEPTDRDIVDVGTVLYRLVQIFGTPQLPEYQAGNDISWRTDDTFKYLLRVRREPEEVVLGEEASADGEEWLVTVFDHRVRLGVGLAAWSEDPDATVSVDPAEAIPLMAVIRHGVVDPVECEYENLRF
ncbi:hypothetical protein BRC81_15085 [Halobacteriales archaeon QS_1_68_20]|nr:MAG: hypothetical protein BRC81_15085 [Halobacteriales archaeon QS_1_68_20]